MVVAAAAVARVLCCRHWSSSSVLVCHLVRYSQVDSTWDVLVLDTWQCVRCVHTSNNWNLHFFFFMPKFWVCHKAIRAKWHACMHAWDDWLIYIDRYNTYIHTCINIKSSTITLTNTHYLTSFFLDWLIYIDCYNTYIHIHTCINIKDSTITLTNTHYWTYFFLDWLIFIDCYNAYIYTHMYKYKVITITLTNTHYLTHFFLDWWIYIDCYYTYIHTHTHV